MLTYLSAAAIGAAIGAIVDGPLIWSEIAGGALALIVWVTPLGWLFVTMIRVADVPHPEFPRHYVKARWVGIIAGALFFPLLTIPAFISVRRLSLYNRLRLANSPSNSQASDR